MLVVSQRESACCVCDRSETRRRRCRAEGTRRRGTYLYDSIANHLCDRQCQLCVQQRKTKSRRQDATGRTLIRAMRGGRCSLFGRGFLGSGGHSEEYELDVMKEVLSSFESVYRTCRAVQVVVVESRVKGSRGTRSAERAGGHCRGGVSNLYRARASRAAPRSPRDHNTPTPADARSESARTDAFPEFGRQQPLHWTGL